MSRLTAIAKAVPGTDSVENTLFKKLREIYMRWNSYAFLQ